MSFLLQFVCKSRVESGVQCVITEQKLEQLNKRSKQLENLRR